MAPRSELQTALEVVCENVYFQPPASVQMTYPAIVYERDRSDTRFADDRPYTVTKQYALTLICKSPDDSIFEMLSSLPMCAHVRHFVVDNLNHDVFNIYF